MAIIRGGNWLDENFSRRESPVWDLSGWEFSRVGVVLVGIFRVEFSGWEFSWVGAVRVGIFRVEFSWARIVQVGLILGGNFLWWKFSG